MSFSTTARGGAFTARGGWTAKTVFYQDDFCIFGGQEYQSLLPVNVGNQPDVSAFAWVPTGGGTGGAVLANGTDTAGRTSNLKQASGVAAPSLRQFVFVSDAPFNAASDAVRVTDGNMTSGTNVVTSATANFKQGNAVKVTAAGAVNGPTWLDIYGYVGPGSTATSANLFSDNSTFVTPLNASHTVAGAIVDYGTDDSAAHNAAITAVAAAGGGTVACLPFTGVLIGSVQPGNNVTYDGAGAVFYKYTNRPLFENNGPGGRGAQGIHDWTLKNVVQQGNNNEFNPAPLEAFCLYFQMVNVRLYDCKVFNGGQGSYYFADVTGCRLVNCDQFNCFQDLGPGGGINPVNFACKAHADVYPMTDILMEGCHLENMQTGLGVDFVPLVAQTNQTVPMRGRVVGNDFQVKTGFTGSASVISAEWQNALAGSFLQLEIVGNQCIGAIAISGAGGEASQIRNCTIAGNSCSFIQFQGSFSTITGNTVDNANAPVTSSFNFGILMLTSTNSVAVNVTTTNTSPNVVVNSGGVGLRNGDRVNSANWPASSYIVSGANTANWVISNPATVSSTVAATGVNSSVGNSVSSNTIHIVNPSASITYIPISLNGNSLGQCNSNTLYYEPGCSNITSSDGITFTRCAWMQCNDNKIYNATRNGIKVQLSNDIELEDNTIQNPCQTNTGNNGILLTTTVGNLNVIKGNRVTEDRVAPGETPVMQWGILWDTSCTNVVCTDNKGFGGTSGTVNKGATLVAPGVCTEFRNNLGANPIGVVVVAVPATGVAVPAASYDRTFYVTAGTTACTMQIQNGPSPVIPGATFGTVRVPAGKTVTPAFANAPTWVVEGE